MLDRIQIKPFKETVKDIVAEVSEFIEKLQRVTHRFC